jgi:hypothetical protein
VDGGHHRIPPRAQTLIYAFALSWLIYLRTGRPIFLAVMCVALLFMVPGLMAGVKRNVIFELAFVFAAGLHFARGVRLNRLALIAACIFGTVLVHQVGALRHYVNEGHGNAVQAVVVGCHVRAVRVFQPGKSAVS